MAFVVKHKTANMYKAKKKNQNKWTKYLNNARVYSRKCDAVQSIGIKWNNKLIVPDGWSIVPVHLDETYVDSEGFEFFEVESSFVGSAAWKKDVLKIKIGKATYQFSKVPEEIYRGLLQAESKGKYFNKYIKPNFHCEKEC